jgi:hypothetical protein
MTPEETEVLRAARSWWRTKRPADYSEEDHIGSPEVNVMAPAEMRLARAVAMHVENRRKGAR